MKKPQPSANPSTRVTHYYIQIIFTETNQLERILLLVNV